MYYSSYQKLLKETPDSPGKRFLIRLMNTPKPDFEKMGAEVREFEEQLAKEQQKDLLRMIKERNKEQEERN